MLLRAENITFGHTGTPLFANISFTVNEGDRIGLVGDNGAGKSTLFKCLLGRETLQSGQITIARTVGNISYVPQTLPDDLADKTFRQYLTESLPADERTYSDWKVDVSMAELAVPAAIRDLPLKNLSGGWQRMAMIGRATMDDPDLLLLDEPTNYLELGKIFQLERWLGQVVTAPYITISHDRMFLDNCTTSTMHLRGGRLYTHRLPYSRAKAELLREDLAAAKARALEEAEIARLHAAATRLHIWSGGRNDKMEKRAKAMHHRADQLADKKTAVYTAHKRDIDFDAQSTRPNLLLNIKNAAIHTPDHRLLFNIPDLTVEKGDRVAILALNGAGKTQFLTALKRAYHEPVIDRASGILMRFNPQVNIGYFQQHMADLPLSNSISEYIQSLGLSSPDAIKLLINAGFPYNAHNQKITSLSEGEKARLSFLALKAGRHNFFLMDEPTNHIDIDGQEKFENAVIDEGHTCIFVSHDRYIIENIASKFYQVHNGTLQHVSSYAQFYQTATRQLL
jgi:ATPase subunit of ABC transporter with duplicated ATPase domains